MAEIKTLVTNRRVPKPNPPPPDWRQLELVLSLFRTDWCDTAFQTTLLSSVCAILLGCLPAFIKWPTGLWVQGRVSVNNMTPVEEDQIYRWSRTAARPTLTRKISDWCSAFSSSCSCSDSSWAAEKSDQLSPFSGKIRIFRRIMKRLRKVINLHLLSKYDKNMTTRLSLQSKL